MLAPLLHISFMYHYNCILDFDSSITVFLGKLRTIIPGGYAAIREAASMEDRSPLSSLPDHSQLLGQPWFREEGDPYSPTALDEKSFCGCKDGPKSELPTRARGFLLCEQESKSFNDWLCLCIFVEERSSNTGESDNDGRWCLPRTRLTSLQIFRWLKNVHFWFPTIDTTAFLFLPEPALTKDCSWTTNDCSVPLRRK